MQVVEAKSVAGGSQAETLLRTRANKLQHECKMLHETNSRILQRQLEGEDKVADLENKIKSLQTSLLKAERKAKYFE